MDKNGGVDPFETQLPDSPKVAAILLTGGSSRRMGTTKALLGIDGVSLADRAAALLRRVAGLVVEVGPGYSDLPSVREEPPGDGPLVAIRAGSEWLRHEGWSGPVLVLACDIPFGQEDLLIQLIESPGPGSAVPVVGGRPQPLVARWSEYDLERATEQSESGERSLKAVFGPDVSYLDERVWGAFASAASFMDIDSVEDISKIDSCAAIEPVRDWFGLRRAALPVSEASEWVQTDSSGAVATFCGTVRNHSEGRSGVTELEYEAYEGPALERMGRVVAQARSRWPELDRVVALHRLGVLAVGDVAVVISVSSAHRDAAFESCRFLIDAIKASVPIWKKERWDGGEGWGQCAHDLIEPEEHQ